MYGIAASIFFIRLRQADTLLSLHGSELMSSLLWRFILTGLVSTKPCLKKCLTVCFQSIDFVYRVYVLDRPFLPAISVFHIGQRWMSASRFLLIGYVTLCGLNSPSPLFSFFLILSFCSRRLGNAFMLRQCCANVEDCLLAVCRVGINFTGGRTKQGPVHVRTALPPVCASLDLGAA